MGSRGVGVGLGWGAGMGVSGGGLWLGRWAMGGWG